MEQLLNGQGAGFHTQGLTSVSDFLGSVFKLI